MASYTSTFASRIRKAFRAVGIGVAGTAGQLDSAVPLLTSGSGAASASDPNGSLRLRTDGVPEARVGSAWKAIAIADQTFDAGANGIKADVVAESTTATGVTVDGVLLKDALLLNNQVIVCTITAAGGSGGATAGTFSIASKRADESTAISAAKQVLVVVSSASGAGLAAVNTNVTFNTASTGTLVASGSGWALIETDAAGAFACATANSSDETVYFSATTPQGYTDPTDHALVVSSIASATWAA